MHLLIPFAASASQACQDRLAQLALPNFQRVLDRLTLVHTDAGEATSLSLPHERALARCLGLRDADGLIPWAAWQQQAPADQAWAFLTPCHWHAASGQVTLHHPESLKITANESQALRAAMAPFFAEDGIALLDDQPGQWLARGEVFKDLPTASLDRVLGRNIDIWMPDAPQAKTLRRLQNEMQMLLYTHPVNDARTAQGLPAINSFWVHGAGAYTPTDGEEQPPEVPESLRQAALREDWDTWATAWQTLDSQSGPALLAALDRGEALTLTLCGERQALRFEHRPVGLWRKIRGVLGTKPLSNIISLL